MPLTYLFIDAVNDVLKRVGVIEGDAGELVTTTGTAVDDEFTDAGRQRQIDVALQVWGEVQKEVYSLGLFAAEAASATISLVADTREYTVATDFARFAGETYDQRVFRGATTGLIVKEYPGGYAQMLKDQPVATDYTGDPGFFALSPVTAQTVRLDRDPTADQAGHTYNALYEIRLALTSTMATATMALPDDAIESLVPVVAEFWNRTFKEDFDRAIFQNSLVRALGYMTQGQRRDRYGVRRG